MSHHVCKASHLTGPYSLLYLWSRAAVFCTPPQKFKEHQKKTMIIGHYPLAMNDTLAGVNKSHFENGKPRIQMWKSWAPGMHLWDFKRAGKQIRDLCMLKMSDTGNHSESCSEYSVYWHHIMWSTYELSWSTVNHSLAQGEPISWK